MSLFGGGAFGSNNANQQQQNTSAFGQSASQPAGSLFGANNQQKPSIFGAPATTPNNTGGLFGQQPQQQGQQPATGGSIFGANTNTSQPAGQSGGLFGGASTSQPNGQSGGLFGNTQTQPQQQQNQPATGSLFGNTQNQNQTQQPATGSTNNLFGGSSLFNKPAGQTNGTGTTGYLFGQPQQQQQPQQTSSLFGSTNNAQNQNQNQPKPGLFGQSTSNNLFGGSTTQPQVNSLGVSSFQPAGGNALAGSSNLLASRASTQPQPDAQVQFAKLSEKIIAVKNAWDPSSPQCRFQHCFYNLVEPSQAPLYGRPPNATSDAMWQKAQRENPDPSCMVPVIANGFDDIRERVEAQMQQATAHTQKLQEIQQRLNTLMTSHSTSTVPRLSKFTATQTQLTIRMLKLIQHLHLLIPSVRSSSIKPEEEALRNHLEEIESILLGGNGRIRGKLGELWAIIGALRARENAKASGRNGEQWRVVDEDGLARIVQVLQEQQAGLAHLTQVLQKDKKDVNFILNSESEANEGVDMEFSGSQSLLTASALR